MKKIIYISLLVLSALNTSAQTELISTGTGAAYVISYPAAFSYSAGITITFKAHAASTAGPVTLNVNSLGARTIKKNVTTDLALGDIILNQYVTVIYDGTNFQLTTPSISPAAGTQWNLTGNIGTTAGTNFIGTTDAVDLVVKTNNTEKLRVFSDGKIGVGTTTPVARFDLVTPAAGTDALAFNIIQNYNGSGTQQSLYITTSATGTGVKYGIFNNLNSSAGAQSNYGIYTQFTPLATTTGVLYGAYNLISGVGTGARYGNYNEIYTTTSNTGIVQGVVNNIGPSGTGSVSGIVNSISDAGTTASGNRTGVSNSITTNNTTGGGTIYGVDNTIASASTALVSVFGNRNTITNIGNGPRYGVSNNISSSATNAYDLNGVLNTFNPLGTGDVHGIYNTINSGGSGLRYGIRNQITPGATGDAYGLYNLFIPAGTGVKYGVYSSGEDNNYFSNNIGIGTATATERLQILDNNAAIDGTDGVSIQVTNSNQTTGSTASINFVTNGSASSKGKTGIIHEDAGSNGIGKLHLAATSTITLGYKVGVADAKLTVLNTGNVGIGITTPAAKLDIAGNIKITDGTQAAGRVLTSDATGTATWQDNPAKTSAFRAGASSQVIAASAYTIVDWNTAPLNDGADFNTTTDRYTAPVTGLYYFETGIYFPSYTGRCHTEFLVNGATNHSSTFGNANGQYTNRTSLLIKLNAGDYVQVRVYNINGTSDNIGNGITENWFSGYRIY